MADDNVITDWPAYFARINSERGTKPPCLGADHSEQFVGEARPFVVYIRDPVTADLEYADVSGFDEAREIYQANQGPEMWLFWSTGSAPWHCPALPKMKQKGRRAQ